MNAKRKVLGIDTNYKTVKGRKLGYMTGILYLAPAKISGFEVCPQRSEGCTAACLYTAGRGGMTKVQDARIAKTQWYFTDRDDFMLSLVRDIEALIRKAKREGLTPVVRLNGTSDIPFERVPVPTGSGDDWDGGHYSNVMVLFPDVQFYDYSKVTKRALLHAAGTMPANYHLTFSLNETNDDDARKVLAAGGNVAAVFFDAPAEFMGAPVVDGDASDVRFDDDKSALVQGLITTTEQGVVIGLTAKGAAKKDTSGFVR